MDFLRQSLFPRKTEAINFACLCFHVHACFLFECTSIIKDCFGWDSLFFVVVARTHNLAVEITLYKPMLVGRCFLICLPPSVLLATYGLLQLPRPVSGSALAVLAVASCSSVLSYYRHLGWKEDWRGAT